MPFNRSFSERQRLAVEQAAQRGIRPYRRIAEMASAGELSCDGESVDAFEIDVQTVGYFAREERRRRTGMRSELQEKPPMDALEVMRRRLLSELDRHTEALERSEPGKASSLDMLLKLARGTRELAALSKSTLAQDASEPAPEARARRPSALAQAAIASLSAPSADTDTASVDGAEATDIPWTPEEQSEQPEAVSDGADFGCSPGARPSQGLPLEQQLRAQLYGA